MASWHAVALGHGHPAVAEALGLVGVVEGDHLVASAGAFVGTGQLAHYGTDQGKSEGRLEPGKDGRNGTREP